MHINPLNDAENLRQQRNLTNSQKRNNLSTKEGVVVNSTVKEGLSEAKSNYMISDEISMPAQLYTDKKIVDKKLLPLSAIVLGVMSSIAILTGFVNHSAKIAKNLAKEKWLPALTRNVNINSEYSQVMYQMVQSPNKKTFLAGIGTLTLGAMAFMGQTFLEGYKEIWVKRKDSDIQKNLQENLVAVETESFAGKMQIIRSMLSKYATDFEKYLKDDNEKILPNFGKNKYVTSFTSQDQLQKQENKKQNSNLANIVLGIGTFVGIVGLGYLSLKNLTKSKINLDEGLQRTKSAIEELVKTSKEDRKSVV